MHALFKQPGVYCVQDQTIPKAVMIGNKQYRPAFINCNLIISYFPEMPVHQPFHVIVHGPEDEPVVFWVDHELIFI
jgi:hypothetical protein